MKDELITFETAKLAKEKGFKIDSDSYTYIDKNGLEWYTSIEGGITGKEITVQRCTQSLLHRWLREKHKLYPHTYSVHGGDGVKWGCDVYDLGEGLGEDDDYTVYSWFDNLSKQNFCDTFEQALEIGLQEALKLIKT